MPDFGDGLLHAGGPGVPAGRSEIVPRSRADRNFKALYESILGRMTGNLLAIA